jgi:hypothetical protein
MQDDNSAAYGEDATSPYANPQPDTLLLVAAGGEQVPAGLGAVLAWAADNEDIPHSIDLRLPSSRSTTPTLRANPLASLPSGSPQPHREAELTSGPEVVQRIRRTPLLIRLSQLLLLKDLSRVRIA